MRFQLISISLVIILYMRANVFKMRKVAKCFAFSNQNAPSFSSEDPAPKIASLAIMK